MRVLTASRGRLACAVGLGLALVVAVLAGPAAAQSTDIFSGFSGKSKDPIQVDAETLEIVEEDRQRISTFAGGVTVTRGNTVMKAATIRLFSDLGSKNDDTGFTRMEATGTVYVNSGNQTVTGSRAVVDNAAQTITLTGDVVLSQGKNVIVGDRLTIDMATGRARVEQAPGKRIQGVFTPDGVRKQNDDKAGTQ